MTLLKLGSRGNEVFKLQQYLTKIGYKLTPDGIFGLDTLTAVHEFQKSKKLTVDGIVGHQTFSLLKSLAEQLEHKVVSNDLNIIDCIMEDGEYIAEETVKNTIYLHHTAGNYSAKSTILGAWENDKNKYGKKLPVATAFVIGGYNSKDLAMDGAIYRAFDEKYYAYHLGLTASNNLLLNKQSVAIEVCNWGYLTKTKEGKFQNYVYQEIKDSDVCELDKPYRGFKYYHKYSEKQIEALRKLLIYLSAKFNIDIKKQWTADSFEISKTALSGVGGIYTHGNVKETKSDIYPAQIMIDMLNSL